MSYLILSSCSIYSKASAQRSPMTRSHCQRALLLRSLARSQEGDAAPRNESRPGHRSRRQQRKGGGSAVESTTRFSFDHVFGPECATHTLYDAVCAEIISGAFEGYNGTIFCYGQTASGKTHTMVGSAVDPGVTMLAVDGM